MSAATSSKYRCPSCRLTVEPRPTGKMYSDTDGNECEVYRCPTEGCDYSEGHMTPAAKAKLEGNV